jgi:transcriptional regulator with XRE-family HTH domain
MELVCTRIALGEARYWRGCVWGMTPGLQSPNHRYKVDADGGPARARLRLVEHSETHGAGFRSLGLDLRKARQSKGLEISQISSSLKISKRHLNAIEEGDVGVLPLGDVYLIGYTRAYARYLGLNTDQWVERLKTEIAEREARCLVNIVQKPTPENRLSSAVRRMLNLLGMR